MSETGEPVWEVPRVPASAGALLLDERGRLLVLKPTYKRRWTIPGGQIEADGETPWQACRRETREECGIEVDRGRLVCVDYRPAKNARRPGGLRFVFHCGVLGDDRIAAISLQPEEISEHRFVALDEAGELLSGPVGRRVLACFAADRCVYLEDGRPVAAVSG
ncbi:MAG: NUDIX domain-containing protein [Solirubrobacteraceae bacterium]